uniref:ANK_REP_REGION domain-containing protein n=1 Tax=Anopheles coluzzii TaxID=1518534 RepID=A0A6E8W9L8_ANOCL
MQVLPSAFSAKCDAALATSFDANDLSEFNRALRNGANVNLRDRDSRYTVFELACKTPDKKQFIRACLNHGAVLSEKNPETNEYPIHLAALSFDSENLSELLSAPRIQVDQKYEDRTALYLLFEQIDSDNWKHVFECVKLLLEYDANINTTDENSVSPIALLVTAGYDDWRKEILEYCLQNYSVNVDYRRQQARKAIVKNFPGTDIPIYDMEKVTVEVLRNKLNVETEDEFLAAYEKYCQQNNGHVPPEEDRAELLPLTVYRAKLTVAQKLIEGQIVEGKFTGNPKLLSGLLAKCCNRGNVQMLEWLLQIIPDDEVALVNEDPLLSLLVKKIDVYPDKSSYIRIMRILLNDPRLDIDNIDVKKCTALHYAVKYQIDHAQKLLLDEGAYIWGENIFGDLPISEIDSSLLEKHLDSCVTNNDRKPGDEDYEVRISFANFIPPAHNPNSEDEMRPIVHIAQSPNSKHLLWHPVISSILLLKWMKVIHLLYLNLVICTVCFVSFATYIVFCYAREDTILKQLLYCLSVLGCVYLIVREASQLRLSPATYLLSMENLMEILLIGGYVAVLAHESADETWSMVLVGVLLLLGVELTLQFGMLPINSIATNMVMLKTVTKNFLTSLSLYSIILASFTLSFYTACKMKDIAQLRESNRPVQAGVHNQDIEDEHLFHNFGEIQLALMKTTVMFTVFVFSVTIVINNLINGLAVSDTTTIRAESELVGITEMVSIIRRYEKAQEALEFIHLTLGKIKFLKLGWLFPNMNLFCNEKPLHQIVLKPSDQSLSTIRLEQQIIETVENGGMRKKRTSSTNNTAANSSEMRNGQEEIQLITTNETISNMENGQERTRPTSKNCQLQTHKTYQAENLLYKPFKGMLSKIVTKSIEMLNSRQVHGESQAHRLSRVEQNMTNIMQELKELKELVRGIGKGRRGDDKKS